MRLFSMTWPMAVLSDSSKAAVAVTSMVSATVPILRLKSARAIWSTSTLRRSRVMGLKPAFSTTIL